MPPQALLDHPHVIQVMFHPRREGDLAFSPHSRELRFPLDHSLYLGARLFVADPEGPVILYWHGNGEIAADYEDISQLYTAMGINLLVVDFRGYGISTGTPTGSNLLADAVVVLKQVREVMRGHGLTCSKLFVMGRSMGSAAAIEIAFRDPDAIDGLILESGFAFTIPLLERLSGMPLSGIDESHGFGNDEKISKVSTPTLIIHGEEDDIIPVTDGRALFEQSGAQKKQIVTIDSAGHNDLMLVDQTAYFDAIRQFVWGEAA